MFRPKYLLPNYNSKNDLKYQKRWLNTKVQREIIELIEKGAGENFLENYLKNKSIHILEHKRDLKGIHLTSLDIEFPRKENFKNIDFSYSHFYNSKFTKGTFFIHLHFAILYRCEFNKCIFSFTDSIGSEFKNCKFIKCDFIQETYFDNVKFTNCKFIDCFIEKNIFENCVFDENTEFANIKWSSNLSEGIDFRKIAIPGVNKGIKRSYRSGDVYDEARNFFFRQRAAETRHIQKGILKYFNFLIELIAGYGVKPGRTLFTMFFVMAVFSFIFINLGYCIFQSIELSISAFTTMGNIPIEAPDKYFYLFESFLGIGLYGLFLTILANIFFVEK